MDEVLRQVGVDYYENQIVNNFYGYPEYFSERVKQRPLHDSFVKLLGPIEDRKYRILDVGACPLTTLGTLCSVADIEIVPIDIHADAYNQLLDKHNIIPPVKTIYGVGEELSKQFPAEHFDQHKSIRRYREPL